MIAIAGAVWLLCPRFPCLTPKSTVTPDHAFQSEPGQAESDALSTFTSLKHVIPEYHPRTVGSSWVVSRPRMVKKEIMNQAS